MDSTPACHIEDIPFREIDGLSLLGRLYRPAQPVQILVIDVHGGAWTQGDRLNHAVIHQALAARGVATFALDFRMAPAHRYPAAVHDVNFGIRWVKANLPRLGLKPRLIGGLGASSGGQLLITNTLSPEDARFADSRGLPGKTDASLDFVVGCWPIFDPLARYRMAQAKGIANLVKAHQAFWPDEAAMALANPRQILERGEATHLPDMLILQGTADENVEHERADDFAAAYARAGAKVDLQKYPDQPHTFITKSPEAPASLAAITRIVDFVVARDS